MTALSFYAIKRTRDGKSTPRALKLTQLNGLMISYLFRLNRNVRLYGDKQSKFHLFVRLYR